MCEKGYKMMTGSVMFTWKQSDFKPISQESGIRQDDSSMEFRDALSHVTQGLSVFTPPEKTRGNKTTKAAAEIFCIFGEFGLRRLYVNISIIVC